MSCLFCRNFEAVEPPEHRREREANACQYSCGRDWNAYTAARYVREHKLNLAGLCHLNPVPAVVRCEGICSKFQDGFYDTWHIGQPGEKDNLAEWARQKLETHIHGSWDANERKHLREENQELKAALKASRQRSASRLVRLNKLAKKEPPKPPVLRLVAAE